MSIHSQVLGLLQRTKMRRRSLELVKEIALVGAQKQLRRSEYTMTMNERALCANCKMSHLHVGCGKK